MPTASSITPVLVYSVLVSAHTFLVEILGFPPARCIAATMNKWFMARSM